MASLSKLVVNADPLARERIAQELRELGYDVIDSADTASHSDSQPDMQQGVISAGGVSINRISHRVSVDGEFVTLAPREYELLLFLLSNQDRVFSRKQLLIQVWNGSRSVGSRTVDVHIRRLRSVLEPYDCARYVQTVRGTGYRFSLKS